jgi:hypothetical protein
MTGYKDIACFSYNNQTEDYDDELSERYDAYHCDA